MVFFKLADEHDDVVKWKHFSRNWPFARGIHRSPVNSPHKGQWRGALISSLICAWINRWVNNREAGDLRRHRAHYDVVVMGNTASQNWQILQCNHIDIVKIHNSDITRRHAISYYRQVDCLFNKCLACLGQQRKRQFRSTNLLLTISKLVQGHGSVPSRRWAITYINDDHTHWHICIRPPPWIRTLIMKVGGNNRYCALAFYLRLFHSPPVQSWRQEGLCKVHQARTM